MYTYKYMLHTRTTCTHTYIYRYIYILTTGPKSPCSCISAPKATGSVAKISALLFPKVGPSLSASDVFHSEIPLGPARRNIRSVTDVSGQRCAMMQSPLALLQNPSSTQSDLWRTFSGPVGTALLQEESSQNESFEICLLLPSSSRFDLVLNQSSQRVHKRSNRNRLLCTCHFWSEVSTRENLKRTCPALPWKSCTALAV